MSVKNLFLAFLVILPLKTFASGYTRLAIMYMSESSGQGSTSEASRTLIDFGAGKLWGNGFTLGGMYGSEKNEYSTYSRNRTGIGPTIGWLKSKTQGFYILGTYFINPTMTGGFKGKGHQIDIGYRFMLDKVSIAPQLSQKSFSYDEVDGMPISPSYEENRVDPYFAVWIDF